MSQQPLLALVLDKLEPVYDLLKQRNLSEDDLGRLMAGHTHSLILDITEAFVNSDLPEGDLDTQFEGLDADAVNARIRELFQTHVRQDFDSFIEQKVAAIQATLKN